MTGLENALAKDGPLLSPDVVNPKFEAPNSKYHFLVLFIRANYKSPVKAPAKSEIRIQKSDFRIHSNRPQPTPSEALAKDGPLPTGDCSLNSRFCPSAKALHLAD